MTIRNPRDINLILSIMEDDMVPGRTPMGGGIMAQTSMAFPDNHSGDLLNPDNGGYGRDSSPEEPKFTDLELRLARRFMQLVGGIERARDLINRCDECEECLGLVDDDDEQTIDGVASMIPDEVDMPTMRNDLSSLYNPSAIAGPMP